MSPLFRRCLKRKPTDGTHSRSFTVLRDPSPRTGETRSIFTKRGRLPPPLYFVGKKRALCLIKMGKLDAALLDFSKACELEPTVAVYHYQKASLLHHRLAR